MYSYCIDIFFCKHDTSAWEISACAHVAHDCIGFNMIIIIIAVYIQGCAILSLYKDKNMINNIAMSKK